MLGFDRERNLVSLNDTADLYAYLSTVETEGPSADDLLSVEFTIQRPDGTRVTADGTIEEDGAGSLLYEDTDAVGEYRVVATFTLTDGRRVSTKSDFEVVDPFFVPDVVDITGMDEDERHAAYVSIVAQRTWDRFEDLFDSTDGGPWMRDMTLNVFGPQKIPDFIDEALFDINVYNPPTEFSIDMFTQPINERPNPNLTLLVQGTMIAVIRHLMRTYTEQPTPTGGSVTYEDRRDYLQRWGTIYQIEFQHYDHLVKLWKRQFLGLGKSKILIANKAGRLLAGPLRTRHVGRGYY